MREFILHDGPIDVPVIVKQDNDCIFCDHCEFFWDYSHGIHSMICDLYQPEIKNVENHTCILFKESDNNGNL